MNRNYVTYSSFDVCFKAAGHDPGQ
jgi:hypothetical protein